MALYSNRNAPCTFIVKFKGNKSYYFTMYLTKLPNPTDYYFKYKRLCLFIGM